MRGAVPGSRSYSTVSSLNIPAGGGCSNFNVNRAAAGVIVEETMMLGPRKLSKLLKSVLRIKISIGAPFIMHVLSRMAVWRAEWEFIGRQVVLKNLRRPRRWCF